MTRKKDGYIYNINNEGGVEIPDLTYSEKESIKKKNEKKIKKKIIKSLLGVFKRKGFGINYFQKERK